jgi:Asp-tRNA(Asn)/Glu-tRNA(Gln) amidotransferase A subunit family amidase
MNDVDLAFTPAWQLRNWIGEQKLSPVELVSTYLGRIESLNPRLNAFLTVCGDEALAAAKIAEEQVMRGEALGALHGIPVPIKDLNRTAGIRTTRGSLIFKDDVPDMDDLVVARIRAAGAIIIGKTNTPEFGHRGTTENLLGEPCRNPWDTTRTPGGSSGGAAVAVASGLSPISQGSDGGGSIRIPAGFCGVYGLKPTRGRVPGDYSGPGGWNLFSQTGPLSRTVRDAAFLLSAMTAPNPENPMSLLEDPPDFQASLQGGVKGLKVALVPTLGGMAVEPEVQRAVEASAKLLAGMGAQVDEPDVALDGMLLRESFRTIFISDMSANLGWMLESHAEKLMPSMRTFLEDASRWTVADLARSLREMERLKGRMRDLFSTFDVLLTPTAAVPAFPIEGWPDTINGMAVDPRWAFTPFCYLFNMTGQPAASVPAGFSSGGLPIGTHVVGRFGDEATVLRVSAALEEAQPWAGHRPPVS